MFSYVEQKKKIKFTIHIFIKLLLIPIKLSFFKTYVFIKTGQIIITFIFKEKKELICLVNDSIQHCKKCKMIIGIFLYIYNFEYFLNL